MKMYIYENTHMYAHISLEKEMTTHSSIPVFLPGKSHGQRNVTGYSSWGCKESDMTE